jgi:hypothetical protein
MRAEVGRSRGEGRINRRRRVHVEGQLQDVVGVGEVGEAGWVAGCGDEALAGLAGDKSGDLAPNTAGATGYWETGMSADGWMV